MRDVVVGMPLRTPIGRYGGVLRGLSATEMAAGVIRTLVDRSGVEPAEVDDVILGQCYPSGEAPAIGRVAALDAGLPVETPGFQIDRRCGSGLTAVITAVMQVQTGASDLVVAGGAESMSHAEFYATGLRFNGQRGTIELADRLVRARETAGGRNFPVPGGMLETAENLRAKYDISREEQDELADESHHRAVAAQRSGLFDDEIIPLHPQGADAAPVALDEHPRPTSSLEKLASLRPLRRGVDPDATVTAGNASGQNDGAAACIVTTRERAAELGLAPTVRLVSWAAGGVAPHLMGLGPVPATARALRAAGLELSEVDLIELNEAFAAQVLAVLREWEFSDKDRERLNVNGSGISLGHPVGATGARILTTLVHEMHRRHARYGLETMCIGGGQGLAALFERV